MRWVRLLGVAGIVLAMGFAGAGGVRARAAARRGRTGVEEIVFQQGSNPSPDVAVVDTNGRRPRALLRDAGTPVWSPDGKKLAFTEWSSATGGTVAIGVANADGSHVRTLARGRGVWAPAWSPNGKEIAFERPVSGRHFYYYSLYVMNANGSGRRKLLTNASAPAWSPDGTQIAFVRRLPTGLDEIEIADASGKHARKLVGGLVGKPAWSPDGSQIAFENSITVRDHPIPEIDVINVDGSGQQQLTKRVKLQGNMEPAWSPNGMEIAFARDHCYPESICRRSQQVKVDVYAMNADGSGQRRIAQGASWPAWRP